MLRSHKIRLVPNQEQAVYFAKACGTARFAWNWAVAEWNRQYEAHKVDPSLPKPSRVLFADSSTRSSASSFPG